MRVLFIFLVFAGLLLASCKKNNQIPTVSGTINGVTAIPLYGNSLQNADFILLSTDPAHKEISYNGTAYSYYYISTGSDIFISVSATNVQKATLSTSGNITTLAFGVNAQPFFGSSVYISR
jgi:hypothetical protein